MLKKTIWEERLGAKSMEKICQFAQRPTEPWAGALVVYQSAVRAQLTEQYQELSSVHPMQGHMGVALGSRVNQEELWEKSFIVTEGCEAPGSYRRMWFVCWITVWTNRDTKPIRFRIRFGLADEGANLGSGHACLVRTGNSWLGLWEGPRCQGCSWYFVPAGFLTEILCLFALGSPGLALRGTTKFLQQRV